MDEVNAKKGLSLLRKVDLGFGLLMLLGTMGVPLFAQVAGFLVNIFIFQYNLIWIIIFLTAAIWFVVIVVMFGLVLVSAFLPPVDFIKKDFNAKEKISNLDKKFFLPLMVEALGLFIEGLLALLFGMVLFIAFCGFGTCQSFGIANLYTLTNGVWDFGSLNTTPTPTILFFLSFYAILSSKKFGKKKLCEHIPSARQMIN